MIVSRRQVLLAGLAGVAASLAGCAATSDPRLQTSQTDWPRPNTWAAGAAAQMRLAGAYSWAGELEPNWSTWCQGASLLHGAQGAILTQPDPWAGFEPGQTPAPQPSPEPSNPADALDNVMLALADASRTAQDGLASANAGSEALLWAGLVACCAVDAAWCAAPDTRPAYTPGDVTPSMMDAATPAQAAGAALDLLNPLVYLLTTAMGRASADDPLRQLMAARLSQTGPLRDKLQLIIRSAGQSPTPAALSYPLPDHIEVASVVRLAWGNSENDLGQAFTKLAGTQTGDDAVDTANQAGDQLARANSLGQAITWWPGWG